VGQLDWYRNIRPWLVDSGVKSGAWCWSTELRVGNMLYVQDMRANER